MQCECQVAVNTQTTPSDLGCELASKGCYVCIYGHHLLLISQ